jgi:DNA-binding Lrp family transcriptional regulator
MRCFVVRAYVLIEVSAGRSQNLVNALSELDGVRSVAMVTGPYDVIAEIGSDSVESIVDIVELEIHSMQGVTRTTTCACMAG